MVGVPAHSVLIVRHEALVMLGLPLAEQASEWRPSFVIRRFYRFQIFAQGLFWIYKEARHVFIWLKSSILGALACVVAGVVNVHLGRVVGSGVIRLK